VTGQGDQQGPEALATCVDEVAGELIDEGVARGDLGGQLRLHGVEDPGDRQAVGLELPEHGFGDGQARDRATGGHRPARAYRSGCHL